MINNPHQLKLWNGLPVNVIGEIQVDNKPHFIVELTHPVYVNEILVKRIILSIHEFETYTYAENVEVVS